jgi:hypothetical protein
LTTDTTPRAVTNSALLNLGVTGNTLSPAFVFGREKFEITAEE